MKAQQKLLLDQPSKESQKNELNTFLFLTYILQKEKKSMVNWFVCFIQHSKKPVESHKREASVHKKVSLNHTEYAYHDAVNRLKSMLADTYNTVKHNSRGVIYDSDDTDNISVIITIFHY